MIVDELIAILGYDVTGEGELARFNQGINNAEKRARGAAAAINAMQVAVGTFIGTMATMAVVKLGDVIGSLPGDVLKTSAQFEGFQTSLETIEGSADKAKSSMAWIQKFAQTTPYEIAGVTDAFIKLRSYGFDPMDGTLKTLGDTASAMNKTLDQAVEAFSDATTFQFERLKEFGITSSQKGDEVTFSWTKNGKKLTKVVGKNSEEISKFLKEHFGESFNNAMERQSKTWNGMVSNLADTWTNFQKRIGDAGFFENAKGRLSALLDGLNKWAADGTLDKWAKRISNVMSSGLDGAVNTIARLTRHFEFLSKWAKINPEWASRIANGLKLLAAITFPRFTGLLIIEDFLSWLEGHQSVIGDFADQLSKLSGIDAGAIEKVLGPIAAAGGAFLLFGGKFGTVGKGIRAIASALGLMGSAEAAAGVGTLNAIGGLSLAGGMFALAASAAAAAGSIKLLYDAIKADPKLAKAFGEVVLGNVWDRFSALIGAGPNVPETKFATENPLLGPQNKPVQIDKKTREKEAAAFQNQDIEDWKLQQTAKETEAARKAGTLDNGNWWEKSGGKSAPIDMHPVQTPQQQSSATGRNVMDALGAINAKLAGSGDVVSRIVAALQNFKTNSGKADAKPSVQQVINDSSDRSINVTPHVALTVNQIAQAAAAAATATGKAVGDTLKSVPPPSRVMHGAHF